MWLCFVLFMYCGCVSGGVVLWLCDCIIVYVGFDEIFVCVVDYFLIDCLFQVIELCLCEVQL